MPRAARRLLAAALAPALTCCWVGAAAAQPRAGPRVLPRGEELPEPEFAPGPPGLAVPRPPPPTRFGAPDGQSFRVREIRVLGNTVLPPADIAALARPYVGRAVTIEGLIELRDAVTRLYIERGYVNSGAVIPDQEIVDGLVTLEAVEGTLDEVAVTGARNLRPAFVERRLRRGAGPPLDVGPLQEELQLLLLDPNLDRLDARLGPGARPGAGRLEVEVVERPRLVVETRAANDISPSIGGEAVEAVATWRTVAGFSDPLRLAGAFGEGYRRLAAGYSVPLTARDLRLGIELEATHADIVDDDLEPLGIESRSRRATVGLSRPIVRRVRDAVTVGARVERSRSESFLLEEPFAFSPGTDDGRVDLLLLHLDQDWLRRGRDVALAARSTLTIGVDALGATDRGGEPDGEYVAWLGLAEAAARPFGRERGTLVLRGGLQLADDAIPAIEQIAVGGADTVRGYRENELVTDNGWFASAEYRLPVLDLAVPNVSRTPEDGRLVVAPFADLGGGWNERAGDPDPRTLASLGAGLLWSPSENLSLGAYWGLALVDVENRGDDPQDWGIHFSVRARFP